MLFTLLLWVWVSLDSTTLTSGFTPLSSSYSTNRQFPQNSNNAINDQSLPKRIRSVQVFQSSPLPETSDTKISKRTTTLRFTGEKVFTSEPVPIRHSPEHLESFFEKDDIATILLNGERENSARLLTKDETSNSLVHLWTKQCAIVGGINPSIDEGDTVFQVNTGNINFSGLKIQSNSWIGVKYIKNSTRTTHEYQLVFIKDKPTVSGPRLLVWLYNQLTGSSKKDDENEDDEEKEQTIHSLSRFSYEITPDGKDIMFTIQANLEVIVKFPSLLMKILPVSKEKAEEQGSASVLNAMVTDIEACLPKIRNLYINTHQHSRA